MPPGEGVTSSVEVALSEEPTSARDEAVPRGPVPGHPYPMAHRGDVVDELHGELVDDPYRWLEDTDAPETVAWIEAENAVTEAYLAAVASREEIRARLTALWDYPKLGVPFERAGRYFQFRNSGLQDQAVLYVMTSLDDEGAVLLDPNELSPDGTVAISGAEVSQDGALLAYATSLSGSDWMTWHVRDVDTRTDLTDTLAWSKFSTASWRHDGSGFYYGAMERPAEGEELVEESRVLRVLFHRLGTDQDEDTVVFAEADEPEWMPSGTVSDDGRYLVVTIQRGTFPESQLRVLDLEDPDARLRVLVGDFAVKATVVANDGATFYLLTDDRAERQRVVATTLDEPGRDAWREIVPEDDATLLDVAACGGRLLLHHLRDAHSVLSVHELDGTYVRDIPLPGLSSLSGLSGRPESSLVCFGTSSFTESGSLWCHDLASGATELLRGSVAAFDSASFVTERAVATSDDGTAVPMFLTHRRDVVADGDVPVLLYGYGGFEVPLTPGFSVTQAVWMERGGLLAVANLRGGGEHGRAWYDQGRLAHKQNVFDDFAACARHLVDAGWTRPARIAINGASNGGLLVGACLTQHPDLYGAAVPEVGVLDMLRFHKFTIGWAWTSDFGDPEDPEQYLWLRSYSPLHHVVEGTHYPATLVMTGDHDDRVVPGHSFKFAAALQRAQAGDAPVLVRVETAAGHGAGKPTSKVVAERTDLLAFLDSTIGRSA
jgi:prolyl oligopeptidase